jgi:cytoskeletal protein RodZ
MRSQSASAPSPSPRRPLRSLDLPKLREKKGLTLEYIANKTKISIRFLRAIEAEEFEILPGGLFDTSYIRQYAAEIGLDEDELLTQYKEKTGQAEEELRVSPKKGPRSETRNWLDRWFGNAAPAPRS